MLRRTTRKMTLISCAASPSSNASKQNNWPTGNPIKYKRLRWAQPHSRTILLVVGEDEANTGKESTPLEISSL
ncbi:hypothetical protein F0562_033346 [Nyssa sinensis]|uniref:Uncharacterized protein n=1 Tax=Nyssa sinensis TaxID=561372 RepID=A0A5J5AVS9_9ASTE|nr:hypothetical protein F0562_033346 [Nyssa sinensis]